jgi:hypothetical protein
VGADPPFERFLLGFVFGVEIHPHLFVNDPIELVLVCLTHPAADFAAAIEETSRICPSVSQYCSLGAILRLD